jgi:hypothetical protein
MTRRGRIPQQLAVLLCLFSISGCSKPDDSIPHEQPVLGTPETHLQDDKQVEASAPTVEFGGKRWVPTGETIPVDMLWRGQVYASADPNERFVDATPTRTAAIVRIRRIETKDPSGSWGRNGLEEITGQDGTTTLSPYLNGQIDGDRIVFYPSGQMRLKDHYVLGKEHGISQGWYENGQLQYRSEYLLGKEVSGQAFDSDGKPIGPGKR